VAEGFMAGLMDGVLSEIAPNYFIAMKQQEQASAKERHSQQQMDVLGNIIAKTYEPLIANEKNPLRKLTYQQMRDLALAKSPLLAEFFPKAIEQSQKYSFEESGSTSNMKDIEYTGQVDPANYPPPVRAKLMAEHLVRPQTQINMNQGRPAPSSGYMYTTPDISNPTQTYIPGGPADPDKKSLTAEEGKATSYYTTANAANENLNALYPKSDIAKIRTKQLISDVPVIGKASDLVLNKSLSGNEQSLTQAEAQFLDSVNRFRSGANLTEYDIESAKKTFFEMPDDDEQTKKQKAESRQLASEAMKPAAGLTRRKDDVPKLSNAKISRKVIRSGTDENGRRVYMHADGSTDFTPY
jgi:hypothetical protein